MAKKLVIVADDLTGAGDTGVQFSRAGLVVKVIIGMERFREEIGQCDVLVVDLESRMDAARVAFGKCYRLGLLIGEYGDVRVYKKLDSTLRGNIGAEIDGLMEALGMGVTLLAPALPSGGRTVVNGEMYVQGVKLADTEFAADPRTPVKYSAIEDIVREQSGRVCKVVGIGEKTMMEEGIYIYDSVSEEDLENIAAVADDSMDRGGLVAGSSGLARYIGRRYGSSGMKERPSLQGGVFFVFAGSVSEATQAQMQYAFSAGDCELIYLRDLDEEQFSGTLQKVEGALAEGYRRIIFTTALTREHVRVDEAAAASVLGRLAALLIRTFHPAGVLLTGGETAIQTVYALGGTGIRVADEVLPGIQYGYLAGDDVTDAIVVTKAGGFGGNDAILKIFEFFNV